MRIPLPKKIHSLLSPPSLPARMHSRVQSFLLYFFLCLIIATPIEFLSAQANTPIDQEIYFVANADKIKINDPLLPSFTDQINQSKHPTTLLFLGDLLDEKAQKKNQVIVNQPFIKAVKELKRLKGIHFLTGDKDWNDSGKAGKKTVKKLEKDLKKLFDQKKLVLPTDGCPGPKTLNLGKNTVIITFNSQWLIHPYDRPEAPETDCKKLTEADFWEELEEDIEDAKGKNIILAAHHPLYANGHYAGKKLLGRHILPILGTFHKAFHQEIGDPSDFSNPKYQNFRNHLSGIMAKHKGLIYISGHERHLEALKIDGNYYLNSGALSEKRALKNSENTLVRGRERGWMKLIIFKNGKIELEVNEYKKGQILPIQKIKLFQSACDSNLAQIPVNERWNPCKIEKEVVENELFINSDTLLNAIAGIEYGASKFHQFWMGKNYRAAWTTPIQAPYLDLVKEKGGLTPFERGGGLQTLSLKFRGGDGQEYAFRSINKDPEKSLTFFQKQTLYKKIVKDLITTQHPYGGMVAAHLLDETDILHAHPEIFVMPDHPKLGEFRADFAGRLGTLELRPKGPNKKRKTLGNADDIVSSPKMFRNFFKSNKHRIDKLAYAKARVFDIWLGDWDRHEDNWKWALFKEKKHTRYQPIPRDRDHTFSKWEGVIPSIADIVIPNAENFGFHFGNIQQLSFKARHLDRQLATELTRADWLEAAAYIQEKMKDSVIDAALLEMPDTVRVINEKEIGDKLKSRRADLAKAANGLYDILAKEVEIVGSNKVEIFEVFRLSNGDVTVKYFNENKEGKGELLFERTFLKKETNDLRLFGLGGADRFFIYGESTTTIPLRIIGGKGKDFILDKSKIALTGDWTKIYDTKKEEEIELGNQVDHVELERPVHEAHYNNKAFEYSALTPIPKFRISSGNGFGAELLLTQTFQKFNKPDFGQKYQLKFIWYSINAQRLDLKSTYRHVVKDWDLELHLRLSSLYDKNPFFYGFGNQTIKDSELFEENYYRTDFSTVRFSPSLEKTFLYKSNFRFGLTYEYNNVTAKNKEFSIFNEKGTFPRGINVNNLAGLFTSLNIDFRDNPKFSTNGAQFYFDQFLYSNFSSKNRLFGRLEGYIAQYFTIQPVTFAARVGGATSYGEAPFYHMPALGSNNYLRAYFRNRFIGDHTAFLNTEARISLGTLQTPLFPVKWGLFTFFDSGRVWLRNEDEPDNWHEDWGGGFYIAPLSEEFNVVFTFAKSSEQQDKFYFSIGVGFDLQ